MTAVGLSARLKSLSLPQTEKNGPKDQTRQSRATWHDIFPARNFWEAFSGTPGRSPDVIFTSLHENHLLLCIPEVGGRLDSLLLCISENRSKIAKKSAKTIKGLNFPYVPEEYCD